MELMDMPLDEFMGYLPELEQMGYDRDELIRMYRARNSPMAPVNAAAEASAQEIADAGRRPVAGGLFSKPVGATGWDAIMGLDFEGWNGLTQAASGVGRAVDAPMMAAQGLIPQNDMDLEALGTAGAAMTGGGAAAAPRGSLRAGLAREGSRRVYHGGSGDVRQAAQGRGAWFSETPDLADEYAFGGGTVQQFDINPSRPIEFANAEQRRTIGDVISTAMNGIDEIPDADIPALLARIDVLRSRYGNDARPLFEYWNNDPDVADLFRTLGYDAISVSEKPGGAKTWAALSPDLISANANTSGGLLATAASDTLNPSEQMARRILDMRAAGRATDVTDDMMAQADPQYMFNNTPLPMDEASRLARAQAAGFGDDMYHGSNASFESFNPLATDATGQKVMAYGEGSYLADSPRLAGRYAERRDGGTIYPVRENMENPWGPENSVSALSPDDRAIYMAAESGPEALGYSGRRTDRGVSIVPDPTNIRSRFARFDPEFAHLSNLSAANADYLTGLVASGASDDDVQAAYQMILDLEGPR